MGGIQFGSAPAWRSSLEKAQQLQADAAAALAKAHPPARASLSPKSPMPNVRAEHVYSVGTPSLSGEYILDKRSKSLLASERHPYDSKSLRYSKTPWRHCIRPTKLDACVDSSP